MLTLFICLSIYIYTYIYCMPRQGDRTNKRNHNIFMYYMKRVNPRKKNNHYTATLANDSAISESIGNVSKLFAIRKTKTLEPLYPQQQRKEAHHGILNDYHENMKTGYAYTNNTNINTNFLKSTRINPSNLNETDKVMRRLSLMFAATAANKSSRIWKSVELKVPSKEQIKRSSNSNSTENPQVQMYTTNQIFVLKKHKKIYDKMPLIIKPERQPCTIKYKRPDQSFALHDLVAKPEPSAKLTQSISKEPMRIIEGPPRKNDCVRLAEEVKFVNSNETLQPWVSVTEEEAKHQVRASPLVLQ